MSEATAFWRRIDTPGHETARLRREGRLWILEGAAVFDDPAGPCHLDYAIACNAAWITQWTTVRGWTGSRNLDFAIHRSGEDSRWIMNGVDQPAVKGCIDIDLNFSPSTNLLPIRRLELARGERAVVRAAWLRFPSFELAPLDQSYERVAETTYRYESSGGRFSALLEVDEQGFVERYGDLWVRDE